MTTRQWQTYAEGHNRAFGIHHNPEVKNPYPPNSQDAKDWEEGFNDGIKEIKEMGFNFTYERK